MNDSQCVPAKRLVEIIVGYDSAEDKGAVDTGRVGDVVVEEPRNADSDEANPIALHDKHPRHLFVIDPSLLVRNRLVHLCSEHQDGERANCAQTERDAPDGRELAVGGTADPEEDERDESGDGKAEIDGGVGGEDKVELLAVLLDAFPFGVFRGGDGTGGL